MLGLSKRGGGGAVRKISGEEGRVIRYAWAVGVVGKLC